MLHAMRRLLSFFRRGRLDDELAEERGRGSEGGVGVGREGSNRMGNIVI